MANAPESKSILVTEADVRIIRIALLMLHNSITRSANKMTHDGRTAIADQMTIELKETERVRAKF